MDMPRRDGRSAARRAWARMPRALGALALLTGLLGASGEEASAVTTRIVPTQYATIQQAVNASHAGDTVKILAGTYVFQTITVGVDSLTIAGDCTKPQAVLVDGAGANPTAQQDVTFTINGDNDTLECLQIAHGTDNVQVFGSGFTGTSLRVLGAYDYANPDSHGRNFYVKGASFSLTNSEAFATHAEDVYLGSGAGAALLRNVNLHDVGDTCIYVGAANARILKSRLTNCAYGYGIDQEAVNLDVENSTIANPYFGCVYGGGAGLKVINIDCSYPGNDHATSLYGDNSRVQGGSISNAYNIDYDGVFIDAASAVITGTRFSNLAGKSCIEDIHGGSMITKNVIDACSSTGIQLSTADSDVVSGNIFNNTSIDATSTNSSVFSANVLTNTSLSFHCETSCDEDLITNNTFDGNGISFECDSFYQPMHCDNDTITGNTVNADGGIYFECYGAICAYISIAGTTARDGGSIYLDCYNGICANGSIAGNNVSGGGWISAYIPTNGGFNVSGNTVANSTYYGIILFLNHGVVSGNTLTNNFVGQQGSGGGMGVEGDHNTISNNTLEGNGNDGLQVQGNNNSILGNTETLSALDGLEVWPDSNGNLVQGNVLTQNGASGIHVRDGATSPQVLRKNITSGNQVACTTADPSYVVLGTGANANSFTKCGPEIEPDVAVTRLSAAVPLAHAHTPRPAQSTPHAAKHVGQKPAGPPKES